MFDGRLPLSWMLPPLVVAAACVIFGLAGGYALGIKAQRKISTVESVHIKVKSDAEIRGEIAMQQRIADGQEPLIAGATYKYFEALDLPTNKWKTVLMPVSGKGRWILWELPPTNAVMTPNQ
jgi:hypothetical protein